MKKRVYIYSGEYENYLEDEPDYLTSVVEINEELYKRIKDYEKEHQEIQKIMDKLYDDGKILDSQTKVKLEKMKRKEKKYES